MEPKNPKILLKEIAYNCHCSISTVWKILNQHPETKRLKKDTIQRVIRTATQLGYAKKQQVEKQKNEPRYIALCWGNKTRLNEKKPLFYDFMEGFLVGLSNTSVNLLLNDNLFDFQKAAQKFKDNQCDGLIVIEPDSESIDIFLDLNCPQSILLINSFINSPMSFSFINIDAEAAITMVIDYLLSLGHKTIAFIDQQTPPFNPVYLERKTAFLKISQKHAFDAFCIDEKLTGLKIHRSGYCAYWDGYYGIDWIIKQSFLPTAIICYTDMVAIGAIARLKEEKIAVPEQVSIVGMDNDPISEYFQPALTTIVSPWFEIGQQSAEILITQLHRSPDRPFMPRCIIIQPHIKLRSSCASAT